MSELFKFVIVNGSGTWFDMFDRLADAQAVSARHLGTHVERWYYPLMEDDTHGGPIKLAIPPDVMIDLEKMTPKECEQADRDISGE